jgi:hypothetical protein
VEDQDDQSTAIAAAFRDEFAHWGLTLPSEPAVSGTIHRSGWTVNYRFMTEGEERCLYYFASHRMTNDRLVRIGANGESRTIDSCQEFYLAEDPDAKRKYFEHNRLFYDRVRALGLSEPMSAHTHINAYLRSGGGD